MQALLLLIAFLTLAGCSQVVRVAHTTPSIQLDNAENSLTEGIQTKILIQPQPSSQQKMHAQAGLVVLGPVNTWNVDVDSALPDAVYALFAQHYENVVIGQSCADCGLIVRPEVTHVDVQSISMQSTVGVELRIYDANYRPVLTLNAQGSSSFLSAARVGTGVASYFIPFLGTAVGSLVVEGTVHSALEKALANTNMQLAEAANAGALARTWLPKELKVKKHHGNHEYTAEQVAKSAGCNMASDGIKLQTQEYYKETYSAHCWGKPKFTIACEYGRCELEAEQGIAVAP